MSGDSEAGLHFGTIGSPTLAGSAIANRAGRRDFGTSAENKGYTTLAQLTAQRRSRTGRPAPSLLRSLADGWLVLHARWPNARVHLVTSLLASPHDHVTTKAANERQHRCVPADVLGALHAGALRLDDTDSELTARIFPRSERPTIDELDAVFGDVSGAGTYADAAGRFCCTVRREGEVTLVEVWPPPTDEVAIIASAGGRAAFGRINALGQAIVPLAADDFRLAVGHRARARVGSMFELAAAAPNTGRIDVLVLGDGITLRVDGDRVRITWPRPADGSVVDIGLVVFPSSLESTVSGVEMFAPDAVHEVVPVSSVSNEKLRRSAAAAADALTVEAWIALAIDESISGARDAIRRGLTDAGLWKP